MKHRLETQAKPTDLHGIFNLDTVTQHSDALPVFFGKLGVVVGIKCWALIENRKQYILQYLKMEKLVLVGAICRGNCVQV